MLEELSPRLPLRALTESRPGVNFARNAAVDAARGECIIFTDDDTLVCRVDRAYATAFAAFPDSTSSGVRSCRGSAPRPSWLRETLPTVAAAYGRSKDAGAGRR